MRSKDAYRVVTGAFAALVIAVLAGCSPSEGGSPGTGGSSAGGTVGTAGTSGPGTAGTNGTGTAGTNGTAGTVGPGGSNGGGGAAGTVGPGGTGGAGATAGTGGTTGSGGTGGGTGGSTAGRGGGTAGGGAGRGGAGGAVGGTGGGTGGTGGANTCPVISELNMAWPTNKDPATLGRAATMAFRTRLNGMLPITSSTYGGDGYALAFTWFGALRFSKLSGDTTNNMWFITTFEPYATGSVSVKNDAPGTPMPATVDERAFGDLPLEIYQQNMDARCRTIGLARADQQWVSPNNGITRDARYWADDMYMITALQVEAYRVTKDPMYLTRAATTLLSYGTALQQTNGLFWHTRDSHAHWGRANGWVAAGTAELLVDLPAGSQRDMVMALFKRQLDGLLPLQVSGGNDDGMWRQVLDLATSNPESSCTAMFTFALTTALKNGWLSGTNYATAARRGWIAVGNKTNASGQLDRVCPGTGAAPAGSISQQQAFYANIGLGSNDTHGQAPLLWLAHALLRTDCPGVR